MASSDMSILSRNSSSSKMGSPMFHEFKKQASFFFREKIKTARLALTDVTPAQLMIEEATEGNPWAPDSRVLSSISRAAFELDDYCRIVEILQKRFSTFDEKKWRESYNSAIVLERLLTHGPESVAKEFQEATEVFNEMARFQYIDDKGFNWGLAVRKKSERIVKLLEMGPLLKEERDRARKVSREIQGFGSFSSSDGIGIGRSNSQYNESSDNEVNGDGECKEVEKIESWCSLGEKEEAKSLLGGGEEDCRASDEKHPFYETEKQTCASLLPPGDGLVLGY